MICDECFGTGCNLCEEENEAYDYQRENERIRQTVKEGKKTEGAD